MACCKETRRSTSAYEPRFASAAVVSSFCIAKDVNIFSNWVTIFSVEGILEVESN
jgi:hypothetical protein